MNLGDLQRELDALSNGERRVIALWLKKREREDIAARREKQSLASAILWSVASLVAFFVVDAAIFRSGWYMQYLEPGSSTGNVEQYLQWLWNEPPALVPEIAVVGDSRIAEGFSARQANARLENRLKFWNFGIPGTSPRAWYYIIRASDPSRRRFAAIVLALDNYADEDSFNELADNLVDLHFAIGRLRLSDCWDFAMSMKTWEHRSEALSGCLFKGLTLRRDVREFLLDRVGRLARVRDWRVHGLGYVSGHGGKPEDLRGLFVDSKDRTIHFPANIKDWQKQSVEATVMLKPAPQTGETTRYRQRWLGAILDLYKPSPTRIVLLQLPRSPLSDTEARVPGRSIQSFSGRAGLVIIPSNVFHYLERPDVFADGLHLNSKGRALFSDRVTEQISAIQANN